jgi:hypothetical protein
MFAEGGAVPGGARHGAQPQRDAVQALPFASMSFSLHSAPSRVAFTPPFARLAGSGALFGTAATEPATSIAYPASFCVLTKSGCPKLAGVGCGLEMGMLTSKCWLACTAERALCEPPARRRPQCTRQTDLGP